MKALLERLKQGHRTHKFPALAPQLPDRYRGLPALDASLCASDCRRCGEACPVEAIRRDGGAVTVDLGRCLFCGDCANACPSGALRFTQDFRLATRTRDALQFDGKTLAIANALDAASRKIFGRSLRLREVSAGGCNACEADTNVLNTLAYDLGRFGIQFVASPRHADGLLITGPVTKNMESALRKTYDAVPAPKLVIAVGACAISGGLYRGHAETNPGVDATLPVDLYVPGCPPHPYTILDGLLRLLGRIDA
jgi:Ni,Fe-hydrogenase III small subunit/ferredoxin